MKFEKYLKTQSGRALQKKHFWNVIFSDLIPSSLSHHVNGFHAHLER